MFIQIFNVQYHICLLYDSYLLILCLLFCLILMFKWLDMIHLICLSLLFVIIPLFCIGKGELLQYSTCMNESCQYTVLFLTIMHHQILIFCQFFIIFPTFCQFSSYCVCTIYMYMWYINQYLIY